VIHLALRTRPTLAVLALAAPMAPVGVTTWRSTRRPIAPLHAAATRLGQGHLDARVDVESRDELGELGAAFHRRDHEPAALFPLRAAVTA
jgi:HAMP domain-containing protein